MNFKTLALSTAVLLGFSSYSMAYSIQTIDGGIITTTNVGGMDTFIEGSNKNDWSSLGIDGGGSGQKAETNWVNYVLKSTDITFQVKDESVNLFNVIDEPNLGAFALTSAPAYFLVKDGQPNEEGNTHWLFENTASLDWGVVDFEALFGNRWLNPDNEGFSISHVTEFNGGSVPVPEPSTLALLGIALTSMIAFRRKKTA